MTKMRTHTTNILMKKTKTKMNTDNNNANTHTTTKNDGEGEYINEGEEYEVCTHV